MLFPTVQKNHFISLCSEFSCLYSSERMETETLFVYSLWLNLYLLGFSISKEPYYYLRSDKSFYFSSGNAILVKKLLLYGKRLEGIQWIRQPANRKNV